jgi:hypothetical protein
MELAFGIVHRLATGSGMSSGQNPWVRQLNHAITDLVRKTAESLQHLKLSHQNVSEAMHAWVSASRWQARGAEFDVDPRDEDSWEAANRQQALMQGGAKREMS